MLSSNPTEFVVTAAATTCLAGQAIAVAASCVVQVSLTPSAAGARTGTLTVVQQDGTWDLASATSNLTATAVNGDLSADPTAIDFGVGGEQLRPHVHRDELGVPGHHDRHAARLRWSGL